MRDGKPQAIISLYGPLEILVIQFQASYNIAFRLQLSADWSATRELEYLLPRMWSIRLLPAFRTGPATTSFGGRTFLSGQTKRACNTTAVRRISVDVSPSTLLVMVELFVKYAYLATPFVIHDILLFFLCGWTREGFGMSEETADRG